MPGRDPHESLRAAVSGLLGSAASEGHLEDLPRRWERFDDVALLPSSAFAHERWEAVRSDGLWRAVAGGLGASRLGRMGEVSGEMRESGVEMLLGGDDWAVRRESGVDYGYRLTKCMFSAGNVNERRRMGQVSRAGEVVVDLYAGIGYYALPVLVHSGAAHVHACEWNPEAVLALDRNLEANGVAGRCTVHVGDNRVTSRGLSGVADRVLLGLLPCAEGGYAPALGVLRPDGGVLHVHGLGDAKGHGAWAGQVEASLGAIEPGCSLERLAITRVKSHAPHWDHLVLDVRVSRA